jgi:signal transduction histidine kinase
MIRADGSVPVVNRRAVELLGLPADLMAGCPKLQDIVEWQLANHEFGDEAARDPTLSSLLRDKGATRSNFYYERKRPNGTVLEVRSQTLADGAAVCTYTDITERKKNEAALAVAQARATHAERMQALGQLAGGIAHDFNNVLQAIQGAVSLIDSRSGNPAAARRFSRMILEAADRGSSITRRLLSFARRGNLVPEPVDANALLHDLRDVLSHTLGSPISVQVEIAPDLPPLLADKGQLETVLVNLATNARDAMPGGGTLRLSAAADTVSEGVSHPADVRPGRYLCLSVSDSGVGMDQTMLARVFEPFFTTKPVGQGTGLGLSMVKGFVEQSGGGMTIESRPGKGTSIRLWLPAADSTEIPLAKPATFLADRVAGAPRRVLLVDDEAMVRDTLAASLEEAGYAVTAAADGAEALALLQAPEDLDVLVTDLSMPGISGLMVIEEAQRLRPELPAILLTGYIGHSAQQAIGGTSDRSFILVRKPVTGQQLSDRIEALLAAG